MNRFIVLNRIQCNHCQEIVTSFHVHDYAPCSCGRVAADGGTQYLRRTGTSGDYTDMSIYSDAPWEIIRDNSHRGTRGKNGDEPLKWITLKDMTDDHLHACIKYNEDRGLEESNSSYLYMAELMYREKNKLSIPEHDTDS